MRTGTSSYHPARRERSLNSWISQLYGIGFILQRRNSLPSFREADAATDGSGLKTRNAGEYSIFKYGDKDARQKHLVVVITADVRHKKLLCVDVRIEGKGDTEASIAMEHLSSISRRGIEIRKF